MTVDAEFQKRCHESEEYDEGIIDSDTSIQTQYMVSIVMVSKAIKRDCKGRQIDAEYCHCFQMI